MSEHTESGLKGQAAIITGGGSGIGAAIADVLAAAGINLVLVGRTGEKLTKVAEALGFKYPDVQIKILEANVANEFHAQNIVRHTLAAYGQVDILVNNAGVCSQIGLIQEVSTAWVNQMIDINLKGPIFLMQEVLKQSMVERQSGTIININSVAGKEAYPYWSIYDASKFGLRAITESVAQEQRQNNIKVVGIYPGAVDTPIWESINTESPANREGMLDPDAVAQAVGYVLHQPLKTYIPEITLQPLRPAL